MIKRFTLLAVLVLMLQFTSAQSYNLNPGNSVSGSIASDGTLFLEIKMENISGQDLTLAWERLSNTCPAEWSVAMCDYQACFPNIPASRTMETVPAGGEGFIKLTVQPSGFVGTGVVTFRVFNVANTVEEDTISFDINSVVGIDDYNLASTVALYPNPATNVVNLAALNGTLDPGTITVSTLSGATLLTRQTGSTAVHTLSVEELPAGIYLLRYQTSAGVFTSKLIRK